MKTFMLIATFLGYDSPIETHVIETQMTGEKCIAEMLKADEHVAPHFVLSCEFDYGPEGLL
jgi:hypothetical protein